MAKRKRSIDTETEKKIMQYFSLREDYVQLEKKIIEVGNIEDECRAQGDHAQENEYNQQWFELVDQATHVYNEMQSFTPIFNEIDLFSRRYVEIEGKVKNLAFFRKCFSRTSTESTLETRSTTTTLETHSQESISLNAPATMFRSFSPSPLLEQPSIKTTKPSH